jgi:hypothetical protein
MATISNDHDLRDALNALSAQQQRIMGARFAKGVMHLCKDERVRRAAETALRPDASEAELEDALRAARSYATKTYTDCGKDTDWLAQADHFVAAAVAGALTPPAQLSEKVNPAWKAAVQARMAVNCAMMEESEGQEESEQERQYRIASEKV